MSLPDARDRYCLFSLLDGWTTVFRALGKRTTGTGPQKCAITGPGWKGRLPPGLQEIKSPTSIVWVLGRIYCTGTPEDYAAVHAIQDECSAVPLSSFGKPYTPPPGRVDPAIDMKTSVREQVNTWMRRPSSTGWPLLMKDNPPASADARIIKRMAQLGIVPGQPFDVNKLDSTLIQVFDNVPRLPRPTPWLGSGTASKSATRPSRTAGYSRARPAATAPTTSSGPCWRPLAGEPACRRTPSLPSQRGRSRSALQREFQVCNALCPGSGAELPTASGP